jgi:hypothetical protein
MTTAELVNTLDQEIINDGPAIEFKGSYILLTLDQEDSL